MTTTPPTPAPAPFGSAAFIRDQQAAEYLGVCVRSVRYLVTGGNLRRVYPKPRAARLTVESVTAYRAAIEAGELPKVWSQPGNPHTQAQAPTPQPVPKKGLLSRWGLGSATD